MVLLSIFVLVPLAIYYATSAGKGGIWGLQKAGETTQGQGAYRLTRVSLWKLGRAPISVRIAALSSFFLGQMIVPGAIAAFVGLIATAEILTRQPMNFESWVIVLLELSAPTGLVVAALLLAAGTSMLTRNPRAAASARNAARWAIAHNLTLLAALAFLKAALTGGDITLVLPSVAYAFVSIGHALLLRRAADALEAYDREQHEHPAPAEGAQIIA